MSYSNQSILDIQLSEWENIKIDDDNDTFIIPSEKMLIELTTIPVKDIILITNILRLYGATKKQEKDVSEMMRLANFKDKNWFVKILDKLVDDESDNKLIIRLSLENYRLPQLFDTNSHLIFKQMSDVLIRNIRVEDERSSPIDRIIKKFLDKKEISNREFLRNLSLGDAMNYVFENFFGNGEDLSQISYARFRYHKLVIDYFDDIAPFRINYTSNVDKDRIFNDQLQEFYRQAMDTSKEKILNEKIIFSKKQQEYHERINESCRRKMVLFDDYYDAKIYTAKIYRLLAQECPEFIELQIDWNDRVRKSNERKSKCKNRQRQMLCICEFCYMFRWFVKVKGGAVAWHCEKKECKDQYRAWMNYLGSKDINITSKSS
jgi:hypothetical protein